MSLGHEHSVGVARCAVLIGARLGFDEDGLDALRLAGVLHDIGKTAVPEEVLRKPEPLTEAERRRSWRSTARGRGCAANVVVSADDVGVDSSGRRNTIDFVLSDRRSDGGEERFVSVADAGGARGDRGAISGWGSGGGCGRGVRDGADVGGSDS